MDNDHLLQHIRDLEARIFALEMRVWMHEATERRRMGQPIPPAPLGSSLRSDASKRRDAERESRAEEL